MEWFNNKQMKKMEDREEESFVQQSPSQPLQPFRLIIQLLQNYP